jgi:hypothetical protein
MKQFSGLFDSLRCACHCINLVLDGVAALDQDDFVKRVLEHLKPIVTYYKRHGHDEELGRTLKQAIVSKMIDVLSVFWSS